MRLIVVAAGIFTICVLSLPDRGTPLGQRAPQAEKGGLGEAIMRSQKPGSDKSPARCPGVRKGIRFYRAATWRWQDQRDAPRTRSGFADRKSRSCDYVRWAAGLWRNRAGKAKAAFRSWFTRTYEKWRCIHEHEGAWNDTGSPHWGGLQMDLDFQQTYGSEFLARFGTADRWPIWAQLLAAERAYHGYRGHRARGFGPWPNTARECGLIR